MIDKPGIYNIPAHEYHADSVGESPSLSASIAHILCSQSPAHAWTASPRLNPNFVPEDSKAMDLGKIVHALILEGLNVAHIIQAKNKDGEIVSDWRTKAAQEERDTARESGKVPILACQWPDIQAMVTAARQQLNSHKEAKDAFTDGKPELTLTWTEDGIQCRSRLDFLSSNFKRVDDLKTTGISANPDQFSRSMFNNGLDIQAAFYLRGVKKVTGVDAQFRFVVIETFPPFALSVISPGPDVLTLGEKKIIYAMDLWRTCLATGIFPGYPTRVCYAELPTWEESRWLAKEIGEYESA